MYKSLGFAIVVALVGSISIATREEKKTSSASNSGVVSSWTKYENNFGFEFFYPDCVMLSANWADEGDMKLNEVESVAFRNKCADRDFPVRFMTIGKAYGGNPKNQTVQEAFEVVARDIRIHRKTSGDHYFPREQSSNEYDPIEVFRESSGGGYIRWRHYRICGDSLIKFEIGSDYTPSEELYKKVKEGDPYIPEIEKKIIDSFKCTAKNK